jgi:hypothetical protein
MNTLQRRVRMSHYIPGTACRITEAGEVRLRRQELDEWLQDYSLGELWRKGEIGGKP